MEDAIISPTVIRVAADISLCYNRFRNNKEVFSMLAHKSLETAGEVPAK
jgi:hypothetical protein